MNIPKTTPFTLKRIVESLNEIPSNGFGQETPKLTPQQKAQLKEMAYMFFEYGKEFQNEQAIMEASKAIGEFMKLAETYAVNEGPDWFDKNRITKDFQEAQKKVKEFQKMAQECYTRKQHLAVLFDDLHHTVSRYFKVGKPEEFEHPNDKHPQVTSTLPESKKPSKKK